MPTSAQSSSPRLGYWGPPTGNPDWCEENYVVSYYIAEFWNTLSSVPIVLAGLYGLRQSVRQGYGWQYSVSWAALAVVGVGSVAFHGTLLFEGQALDELSMIWCVAIFLVVSLRRPPVTFAVCCLYLPAFTYSYFIATEYFIFFVLSYIFIVGILVVRSVLLAWGAKSKTMKVLVSVAGGIYVGGFACLWLPEHFLCVLVEHSERPALVVSLQLHAWFHLTSTIGPYSYLLFAQLERYQKQGARLTTEGTILPVVVMEGKTRTL